MDKDIKKITVIIPAYKPGSSLPDVIKNLIDFGFSDILVVDDGGGNDYLHIFEEIGKIRECTVLTHDVNRGKGAALKTAMAYFLENRPFQAGVVTADADGQHLAADIFGVSKTMLCGNKVVLGCRNFSESSVPFKSKAGNRITSTVFKAFFGMKLSDTQTGLRAFPTKYLPDIIKAKGDRYEFETDMLILINRLNIPLEEHVISTVYIDDNNSSHFNPIKDSIRIYSLIFKYAFSSLIGAVTDELVFFLCKEFSIFAFLPVPLTFSSAFFARAISSFVNYQINANIVFGDSPSKKSFFKYYSLVVLIIALSTVLVFAVENLLSIKSALMVTVIKTIIDTLLFFLSFRLQHKWVFNN